MRLMKSFALVLLLCATTVVRAQEAKPAGGTAENQQASATSLRSSTFYRLDYVLREMEGSKEISKRNYTITIRSGHDYERLRTGSRVPVATGGPVAGQPQFQYMDVGVNIDSTTENYANGVYLNVTADLTSIATVEGSTASSNTPPLVRQAKISGLVPLIPGKTQLVFAADEPTSSRRFELTVTATELK